MTLSKMEMAQKIDHTLLKPNAGTEDYVKLCGEAKEFGFYSVCVPPLYVPTCAKELDGSKVKLCSVAGFPLGYSTKTTKTFEARELVDLGLR